MPTPPKPTAATAGLTAWSFSRLNDWRKCAKYAYFKHVLRMKEPGSEALDRGSRIGELAEKFASPKGKRMKTPAELATFEIEFRDLQKRQVRSEEEWAFTKEWKPTGWFDKDAWARCKVDAFHIETRGLPTKTMPPKFQVKPPPQRIVGVVIDYKTGKINPTHLEQVTLYALAAFLMFPEIEAVEVQLWYLDHGVLHPDPLRTFERADVPKLKKEWDGNVSPMLRDRRFVEKPGKGCTWCHFSKGKGGPCKY